MGRVGNLGRKSLDSSSDWENELRALKQKKAVIHTFFCKLSVHHLLGPQASCIPVLLHHLHPVHARHSILHWEHMEDLGFLYTTQDHLLGVTKAEGQNWGGKSLTHSVYHCISKHVPNKCTHNRVLRLPSGLQARAVISFPVYSLGCRLHTR